MIEVPALGGDGLTQARRLGEAESMARELIAVVAGKSLADITVSLHIKLDSAGPDLAELAEKIKQDREHDGSTNPRRSNPPALSRMKWPLPVCRCAISANYSTSRSSE